MPKTTRLRYSRGRQASILPYLVPANLAALGGSRPSNNPPYGSVAQRSVAIRRANNLARNLPILATIDVMSDDEASTNYSSSTVTAPLPKEHLECAICLEFWNLPTSTECGHVFCESCLNAAIAANGNRCPQCGTATSKELNRKLYF